MAKPNSIIDNDFLDEEDVGERFGKDEADKAALRELRDSSFTERPDLPPPGPLIDDDLPVRVTTDADDDIAVEVVNDTPEKDRGKWVADDARDGIPEIPSEDEIKNYSADVQKRINKMTARVHAERRAREERERVSNEAVTLARRLMQENNELKGVLESGEKALMGEHRGRLEGQLAAAKAAYREAHEAGDVNGQIAAQEQLSKAISALERASSHRAVALPREDEKTLERFQTVPTVEPSENARAWNERNKWFGQPGHEAMTHFAMGLHTQAVNEGIRPDTKAYYDRIDGELVARFPERFRRSDSASRANDIDRPNPQRRGLVVAPVSRSAPSGNRETVRLTESQVKLANRLGLTAEQYARQIVADRKRS